MPSFHEYDRAHQRHPRRVPGGFPKTGRAVAGRSRKPAQSLLNAPHLAAIRSRPSSPDFASSPIRERCPAPALVHDQWTSRSATNGNLAAIRHPGVGERNARVRYIQRRVMCATGTHQPTHSKSMDNARVCRAGARGSWCGSWQRGPGHGACPLRARMAAWRRNQTARRPGAADNGRKMYGSGGRPGNIRTAEMINPSGRPAFTTARTGVRHQTAAFIRPDRVGATGQGAATCCTRAPPSVETGSAHPLAGGPREGRCRATVWADAMRPTALRAGTPRVRPHI
jgi:hypothetical protein